MTLGHVHIHMGPLSSVLMYHCGMGRPRFAVYPRASLPTGRYRWLDNAAGECRSPYYPGGGTLRG